MLLRASLLLAVLLVLAIPTARGQSAKQAPGPRHSVTAGTGSVLLSHHNAGTLRKATYAYRFDDMGHVAVTFGHIDATRLEFRPDYIHGWRQRTFRLAEVAVQYDVISVASASWLQHHVGFQFGISLRHRQEEQPLYVQSDADILNGVPAPVSQPWVDRTYVFHEGGQNYWVSTNRDEAYDRGTAMIFQYRMDVHHLSLGAEFGYRNYRLSTPILHYGISAGYRF